MNTLEKYTINLTEAARNGKLDPVIGRDEEIRRVIHVLSRRTKKLSGISPLIILCASPSAIAVLPTPGSPINTGLFLVCF